MTYYRSKYIKSKLVNPLPVLQEDERIYLNVQPYCNEFAKSCRCGYCPHKRLWFTGCLNSYIDSLIDLYGIHPSTSVNAFKLLKDNI